MALRGNHYEVLGLDPRATLEQVERAYRFARVTYGEDALATYSLLDPDESRAARERIDDAYAVLSDPMRRLEYDVSQGLLGDVRTAVLPFPPVAAPPHAPVAIAEVAVPKPAPLPEPPLQVSSEPATGAELKRFRESRGVTLRDIASASKIGVRFLEYIEAERYTHLPASVYLRGFLHEYAKAVGLDPRRTADAYMARVPKQS
jgi:hypothetical protein